MKKTIKYVSLIAVLVLSLVSSVTAMAEDRKGTSGWQVSFDGKKMESNFSSANMGDEINSMQPGDSVELTVTIKNTFNGQADWYMKNEVLEALEDAADAAGGAYDYLLTYTDAKGETTTLYSSEKFGGDGKINGVGLHGATKTLDDYFYLERLGDNGKGTVKLKVKRWLMITRIRWQGCRWILQRSWCSLAHRLPDSSPAKTRIRREAGVTLYELVMIHRLCCMLL